MNIRTVSLFAALLLLLLVGCGDETADNKPKSDGSTTPVDEVTSIGELPAILGEGLTPEEQEELRQQILPEGSEDEATAEEKFKELLEQAKGGDPKAQNELGVMYYTGEAVSTTMSGQVLDNDPELAAGWFFRSAEQGYADAQFNLGLMYANGEGVEVDTSLAVDLFKQAAEQGNVDAQNNLAAMYYTGEGIDRDVDKAIEWFEKAAKQGNAEAQANLDAIRAAGQ
jgi:uncharacterized protein